MTNQTDFSWEKLEKPILCLAPMAGFTDSAFRQIVKEIEASVICFSELTSINAMEYSNAKTDRMLQFEEIEQPLVIQLFGNDADYFVDAAKKMEKMNIKAIDINMGCPAPKVTKNCYGSALLEKPELAGEIVSKLSKAVKIPISVKIRIGYKSYDEEKFVKFIKTLESSGAANLTIHGRTTKQGYTGEANFEPIYLAKSLLKIPVIGNGDITSPEKALKMIKNLDGLMVGRGVIGNPWIMKDIFQTLKTGEITQSASLPFDKKLQTILKHFDLALKLHGERIGLLEMRKHLGGYISGIPNASNFRSEIMQAKTPEETIRILRSIPA